MIPADFTSIALAVGFPALAGLAASIGSEHLLVPRTEAIWRRPVSATCLHVGSWLLVFCLLTILLQRPWFAMGGVMAFQLLLVVVHNAKFQSMREPFLLHDFDYFIDAIKHPRLYLPFLGVYNAAAAVIAFVLVITAGLSLEASLLTGGSSAAPQLLAVWGSVVVLALLCLVVGYCRLLLPDRLDAHTDYYRHGQVGFFWLYAKAYLNHRTSRIDALPAGEQAAGGDHTLPNVVAVQSESFFDARRDYFQVQPSVLKHYDQISSESLYRGRLAVPAWGANTIRTEAVFLTGVPAQALGVHQFSPYRHFLKNTPVTLAHRMRALGYKTVCIHPYPASFYLRDKLYPTLGFDEFIDIKAFSDADRDGQYIGDLAVARKVCELLESYQAPLFVFVITMENHGPLHLETASEEDKRSLYREVQPQNCDDLTVYLRHLMNADQMLHNIQRSLCQQVRPGLLCWYGDHVPIMAQVYDALGAPEGTTDYLLWNTAGGTCPQTVDRDISELAPLLMQQVLASPAAFQEGGICAANFAVDTPSASADS